MADQTVFQRELQQANEHKNKGNEAFGKSEIQTATFEYHKAMNILRSRCSTATPNQAAAGNPMMEGLLNQQSGGKPSEAEQQEMQALYNTVRLNLTACLSKNGRHQRVVELCDEVIANDPTLVKAFFRRGTAHLELNNFAKAKEDFEKIKALTQDPATLKTTVRPLQRIAVWEKQQDEQQKKAYANMFS